MPFGFDANIVTSQLPNGGQTQPAPTTNPAPNPPAPATSPAPGTWIGAPSAPGAAGTGAPGTNFTSAGWTQKGGTDAAGNTLWVNDATGRIVIVNPQGVVSQSYANEDAYRTDVISRQGRPISDIKGL